MVEQVITYLYYTESKGIIYHHTNRISSLPSYTDLREANITELFFPIVTIFLQLIGTVDASYTLDINNHYSITG